MIYRTRDRRQPGRPRLSWTAAKTTKCYGSVRSAKLRKGSRYIMHYRESSEKSPGILYTIVKARKKSRYIMHYLESSQEFCDFFSLRVHHHKMSPDDACNIQTITMSSSVVHSVCQATDDRPSNGTKPQGNQWTN